MRFLPVDRIGTLIAVAPNTGAFETIETWIKKLDVAVSSTSGVIDTYVYHVHYGRADCLAMALNRPEWPADDVVEDGGVARDRWRALRARFPAVRAGQGRIA